MTVQIRQSLMPITSYYKKSSYGSIAPTSITIHNTYNDASASFEIAYMKRLDTGTNVSFHYAVDETEVVQGLPENRSAIHAGTRAGNTTSLSIEICRSLSGGDKFIQAEKNGAWLAAKILHERGWDISHVRTHQSWSGKFCPHRTLNMGWQRFLNMVQAELDVYTPVAPVEPLPTITDRSVVIYDVHVQDKGWMPTVADGDIAGTVGQSLRVEAIKIKLQNVDGGVQYRTHVQDIGWMEHVSNWELSGTMSQSKRLEAIEILLTGQYSLTHNIEYCVHVQDYGWMDWCKNGQTSGTIGHCKRIEAIKIRVVPK